MHGETIQQGDGHELFFPGHGPGIYSMFGLSIENHRNQAWFRGVRRARRRAGLRRWVQRLNAMPLFAALLATPAKPVAWPQSRRWLMGSPSRHPSASS